MKEFFEWTAVPMETPHSYGLFHLLFFIIGLAICITVAYFLRNTNEKQNKIVLGVVSGFLIITEIFKQLFYLYIFGNGNYVWWIFPFQLCSIPMYLGIIVLFVKNQTVKQYIYEFLFTINMFGGFISFLEPSGLNHPYLALTLHAYIWHLLLIFIGLYLYFSKRACNNPKGYLKGIATFGIFCVLAQVLNITLQKPGFNMFYISPYVQSPIAVFSTIYANYGWIVNMFLYLLAICLGSAIIYYILFFCRKIGKKKKTQKAIVEEKT